MRRGSWSSPSIDARVRPRARREVAQVLPDLGQRPSRRRHRRCAPDRWPPPPPGHRGPPWTPARRATRRRPAVPAVNTAASAVISAKSDMPTMSAPCPADGPITAAHDRHPTRAAGLDQQVGGGPAPAGLAPMAGALEQHDQRDALGQGQLGDAPALRVAAETDRAAERGEVLGADHDRTPVDQPAAGDEAVGRDVAADERADLAERARVEEVVEALAGVEPSLVVALRQAVLAAHRPRRPAAGGQVGEGRAPAAGQVVSSCESDGPVTSAPPGGPGARPPRRCGASSPRAGRP